MCGTIGEGYPLTIVAEVCLSFLFILMSAGGVDGRRHICGVVSGLC